MAKLNKNSQKAIPVKRSSDRCNIDPTEISQEQEKVNFFKNRVSKKSPQMLVFPESNPKKCRLLGYGRNYQKEYRIQYTLQIGGQ